MVQKLQQAFPESDWVMNQAATAQYNLRNFDEAQALFEELRQRDPDRLEVCLHIHEHGMFCMSCMQVQCARDETSSIFQCSMTNLHGLCLLRLAE